MSSAASGLEQLKRGMQATWMAGDFGQIAKYSAKGAEEFVGRLNIQPGSKVLDVACGTGNLAIPAARLGAKVTGIDIASNLLEQARQRAASERLEATFEEGDAEQLAAGTGEFDVVMTMFGAMFAPRPEQVAAELIRVCRPGGTIAMANWTREGFVGKTFGLGARFAPPPEGIPSPLLWGDEEAVKQRLGHGTSNVRTTRQPLVMNYPFSSKELVQFFRNYFGPTQMTFAKLDEKGQQEYSAALENLWNEYNEGAGQGTRVRAEYLEVIATRAQNT
jgi:ubiquinone/menaquinone biosynthesis C-methylase UbiE